MGTDAFGGIINMGTEAAAGVSTLTAQAGQAAALAEVTVTSYTGAGVISAQSLSFGPTGLAASTLSTASALGANGNIAFRAVLTGVDALTSGFIKVVVRWVAA
jgi:spore coat protein U-like protein